MAVITLFWKDQIGLSLAQILLLQGVFSLATLLMEYPSGYLSDLLGYRFSLLLASALGVAGWGFYTVADSFAGVLLAEVLLGVSFAFISGADSALLFETLRRQIVESRSLLGDRLHLYEIHSATIESKVLENVDVLKELQRLLGKKTMESEIVKEALEVAGGPKKRMLRSISLPRGILE